MMLTKLRVDDGSTYFDLDCYFPSLFSLDEEVHGLGLCSLFEQSLFKYCFFNTHLPDLCLPLYLFKFLLLSLCVLFRWNSKEE